MSSVLTQSYFNTEFLEVVPSNSFYPEPSVDGAIISLEPIKKKDLVKDFNRYMIRCLWDQKKRPLKDALNSSFSQYVNSRGGNMDSTGFFLNQLRNIYEHDISTLVEHVTSTEFVDLNNALSNIKLKKIFGGHKPRGGSKNWRIEYADYLK